MTSYTWRGVSGDWNNGSNWTPSGGPPTSSDSATINGTATSTITVDTADVANTLTFSDPNAALDDGGSLKVGSLNLSGGTLDINSNGQLDLYGLSQTGGTINDAGSNSVIEFVNTQIVSNATIDLGQSSPPYDGPSIIDNSGTLTLDDSVTVDVHGYSEIGSSGSIVNDGTIDFETVDGLSYYFTIGGGSFTNYGIIDADEADSEGVFYATTFTNSGTIDIVNTESVYIDASTFTTTTSSVIAIGANSYLDVEPASNWSNLGLITLGSGAILDLSGSISNLGSITNSGGTVDLFGSLNNSGHTLSGSALALTIYGGTITGGAVSGLAFTDSGGTLSGVTYDGPLDLTGDYATVQLTNTAVVGSSGTGRGTVNDTGYYSHLYGNDPADGNVIGNLTINLGNTSGGYSYLTQDTSGTVTYTSTARIDVQGNADALGYSGGNIVNQGAIDQTGSGGIFNIDLTTNSGTIVASATNGTMSINPNSPYSGETFTNNGSIIAAGDYLRIESAILGTGTDTITSNSTLELYKDVSTAFKGPDDQNIDFGGAGTLHLLDPKGFYGEISDFSRHDTIGLYGSWAFSSISHNHGITTLTLHNGSSKHGFDFVGDYTESEFKIISEAVSTITHA